jgi:RNA polymerase sigma factor (sigma-70 family)
MQITKELIQECIKKWTPTIKKWARLYANTVAGYEDLYNEGLMAILEGLKTFDEKRGKLHAHLRVRISTAIKMAGIRSAFAVNIPVGTVTLKYLDNMKKYKNVGLTQSVLERAVQREVPNMVDIKDFVDYHDKRGIGHRYFFDGLTYQEIVAATGVSLATISRIINGIREKAKALKD